MKHRILALTLALVMVFSMLPASALAVSLPVTAISGTGTSDVHANPLYPGLTAPEALTFPRSGSDFDLTATSDYGSLEDAGVTIRENMEARNTYFTIYFAITVPSGADTVECINESTDVALKYAVAHTGDPTEGDYIQWQWGYWQTQFGWSFSGNTCYVEMDFAFEYYTNASQEAQMDVAVRNLLDELNVYNAGDYAKVCAIYDYLCDNVVYDYEHLNDSNYKLMFTAYAALINRTAVCQGYAVLLYRLALELGVDARVVVGIGNGGPHAWNIIELKNLYYDADATWDAGTNGRYSYFLVSEDHFYDHYRDADYDTPEFHAEYPMGSSDYVHTGDPEPTVPEPTDPPHTHVYTPTVFEATCVDQGYTIYTCSCGNSYVGDLVDPLGHVYGAWVTVKAPTCEEAGLEERECTRCGGYGEVRYPDALGHAWDNGTVTKQPTETEEGIRTYSCTRCDATRTEPIPKLDPQPTEPTEPQPTEPTEPEPTVPQPTEPEPTEPTVPEHACVPGAWTVTQYPGAHGPGEKISHCTVCGSELRATAIAEEASHPDGYLVFLQPSGYIKDDALSIQQATAGHLVFFFVEAPSGCTLQNLRIVNFDTGEILPVAVTDLGGGYYCFQMPHSNIAICIEGVRTEGYRVTVTTPGGGNVWISTDLASEGEVFLLSVSPDDTHYLFQIYTYADGTYPAEGVQISETDFEITMPDGNLKIEVCFVPYESPFTDVRKSDYFHNPVLWAAGRGVTSGVSANRFGPNNACTRAQVVTFLWRASGSPEPESYYNPFTDVKESDYFYKAVLWAVENGITSGMSATQFGSSRPCTRAQVVTFLWAALGRPQPSSTYNPFTDVKETDYYYNAVLFAVEYGITSGMSATRFGSGNTCTRAHVVTFLFKTFVG